MTEYSLPSVSAGSASVESEGQLYYAILYKRLEHRWVLVFEGSPGTNPLWILRDNCICKISGKICDT